MATAPIEQELSERRFDRLPAELAERFGSEAAWAQHLRRHDLAFQRHWSADVGVDEAAYYDELLRHSREHCMLYPYHLGLSYSPFEYYTELMADTIRNERSYDTIPNFTAADTMRLLRIGRNEFISIMNACRAKGWMWKRRGLHHKLLPSRPPADLPVEHWWQVVAAEAALQLLQPANPRGRSWIPRRGATLLFSPPPDDSSPAADAPAPPPPPPPAPPPPESPPAEGEVAEGGGGGEEGKGREGEALLDHAAAAASAAYGLTEGEARALRLLLSRGGCCAAGKLPRDALPALYAAKLVRYEVPVLDDDRISLPPLQGFVMNRVGHDHLERLLYEVFVSSDEATPIGQLATLLSQPLPRVKAAVSVAMRLGFARKLTAPRLAAGAEWHPSWLSATSPEAAVEAKEEEAPPCLWADAADEGGARRVGLLVDSQLAACLMMSNLLGPTATSLKQHAVTLYEVGKIAHESLDDFLAAAAHVCRADEADGEVADFYEHVVALRRLLSSLRSPHRPVDLLRTQSLRALAVATRDRVLSRSYRTLIPMAPMASLAEQVFPPPHAAYDYAGPPSSLLASPWLRLCLYASLGEGPPCHVFPRGARVASLPRGVCGHAQLLASPFGGDAVKLAAAYALDAINEMLADAPVLLQPAADEEALHLPLPLPPTHEEPPREGGPSPLRTPPLASAAAHATALRAQHLFGLGSSLGFLRLVRLREDSPYLVETLHFGVPLFDAALCAACCDRVASEDLLSADSLARLAAAHGRLAERVAAFALSHSGGASEADEWVEAVGSAVDDDPHTPAVPYPAAEMVFDGRELRLLPSDTM